MSTVSVIVIFQNALPFLAEALESILAQTYSNWEALLVDDGSSDGSTETALHYAKRYHGRIHYLHHEAHCNRGMSISRNLAIKHATGEYITFLDADDVWLPERLRYHTVILQQYQNVGMVYGP